jgi:hypothetical protein
MQLRRLTLFRHPGAVVIDSHKATEIAFDLIQNVLLKY